MIIVGLILNLFGSLFLGSHIIGMERLKRLEKIILDFPSNISYGVLGGVIYVAIRSMLKTEIRDYEWEKEITTQRLDEIFEKKWSLHWEGDFNTLIEVILKDPIKSIVVFGTLYWIIFMIILSPIILPISVAIKLFSWIQKKFKIESLLGAIGVFLLLLGFILQLIGNLK